MRFRAVEEQLRVITEFFTRVPCAPTTVPATCGSTAITAAQHLSTCVIPAVSLPPSCELARAIEASATRDSTVQCEPVTPVTPASALLPAKSKRVPGVATVAVQHHNPCAAPTVHATKFTQTTTRPATRDSAVQSHTESPVPCASSPTQRACVPGVATAAAQPLNSCAASTVHTADAFAQTFKRLLESVPSQTESLPVVSEPTQEQVARIHSLQRPCEIIDLVLNASGVGQALTAMDVLDRYEHELQFDNTSEDSHKEQALLAALVIGYKWCGLKARGLETGASDSDLRQAGELLGEVDWPPIWD